MQATVTGEVAVTFTGVSGSRIGSNKTEAYMRRVLQIIDTARRLFIPRHRAVHEQDKQDTLLRAVYDAAPVGIAVMDLRGRPVRANPAYQSLTGFTETELHAQTGTSLIHPEDRPRYRTLLRALLDGRRSVFTAIQRYRVKTGALIWVRSTVSLLRDAAGAPCHVVIRAEDISERRQKKAMLQERAEPFHLLVASVTDYAIFMLDPEGRVASWNVGAERIKGFLAEEIIGRHFSRFYLREDVAQGKPASELRTAAAEGRFEDEGWRLRKDGKAFWASVVITPMRDQAGKLCGYAKVTRDLTVRRGLEARVRESEARLQAFLHHSPAAMFMKDPGGRYLHANVKFQQRVGLTGEQIIGRTDAELFAPEDVAGHAAGDNEVLARGAPLEFEEAIQHGGTAGISMVSKFPVRDTAGRITGIGAISMDITERKYVQEGLRISERSLRELIEVLPVAVYACNLSGVIESHNRCAAELWGRDPRDQDNARRLCPYRACDFENAHMHHPECPMGEVLRTGTAVADREIVVERPDGSRRTAIANVIPRRDEHGSLTGAIGCLMDITERKRAEHHFRAYTQQLRVLSRRLVELHEESRLALSRELHDRVGQNLTALSINLGIVLGQLPDPVKLTVAPRLHDSQELVEATVDVITDVMADLRPPLLDDYGLLPALKSIAEQFARRTGIFAAVRGPSSLGRLPQQVELSLCRITQEALTNLAKHARAKHVKLSIALPPGQITLTIADDGIGFDPKANVYDNRHAGWGMLTMRERAVALGGTLMIDSAPGLGTRITVSLAR